MFTVDGSTWSSLFLLVATVNQLSGGDALLPSFPFKDSFPRMALGDAWNLDALEVLPLAPRKVVVFVESCLVLPLSHVVPHSAC